MNIVRFFFIFMLNVEKNICNLDVNYIYQEVSGRGYGDFVMEEFIIVVIVGVIAGNCL